jgi:hypothetical protein
MGKKYFTIEDALKDGLKFHAFSSGGRLRVLSLSRDGEKQDYYGEGTNFDHALRILTDDLKAGGRKYTNVYGTGKKEPHYLTGEYPKGMIDNWVYQGHGMDAEFRNNMIHVDLLRKVILRTPKEIVDLVSETKKTYKWKYLDHPGTHTSSPSKFPNGDFCVSTSCDKNDRDAWYTEIKLTGMADTFKEALEIAFLDSEKESKYIIIE